MAIDLRKDVPIDQIRDMYERVKSFKNISDGFSQRVGYDVLDVAMNNHGEPNKKGSAAFLANIYMIVAESPDMRQFPDFQEPDPTVSKLMRKRYSLSERQANSLATLYANDDATRFLKGLDIPKKPEDLATIMDFHDRDTVAAGFRARLQQQGVDMAEDAFEAALDEMMEVNPRTGHTRFQELVVATNQPEPHSEAPDYGCDDLLALILHNPSQC